MRHVERVCAAISEWESARCGWKEMVASPRCELRELSDQ
jgi:hypothetical protein